MAETLKRASEQLRRISTGAPRPLGDQEFARTSTHHEEFVEAEKHLQKTSFVPGQDIVDDGVKRTGNTFTAIGHTITAVIGAGVLSLPYSISMLGWVAGPICLLIFAFVTLYTSQMLADCGVINGVRQRTYTNVVETVFGRWGYICIGWVQHSNLVLTALAYQITGSLSLQTVATSICSSAGTTNCFDKYWKWSIIFGAIQIVMIQLPDLSYFWWASLIGAAMSFSYSTIALALSINEGNTHGTVGGQSLSPSDKGFGILNAIGAILFAYSFSMILIEIQDTVRGKPKVGPIRPMQRAVQISVALMTTFYLAVAIAGYMAFGNTVPSNILTGFGHPKWVVDWANIMVIIHMIPAYQVYSQPFLGFVEYHYNNWGYAPAFFRGIVFRLVARTAFVCFITFVGICLPFFGDIVGLVGALGFWPATVFFPIECWIRVYKPSPRKRLWLRALNISCCIVTIAATVGSIQLIVVDSQDYTVFSD